MAGFDEGGAEFGHGGVEFFGWYDLAGGVEGEVLLGLHGDHVQVAVGDAVAGDDKAGSVERRKWFPEPFRSFLRL